MRLPFRNNPLGISTVKGRTAFLPEGDYIQCTVSGRRVKRKNPLSSGSIFVDTWAARLMVGFSVKKKPSYTIRDLISNTREYMKMRKVPEDATFVAQHGVYTHKDNTVVQEESGQVFIINTTMSEGDFKLFAENLAEFLIVRMRQEMIVVEIQNNGMVKATWLVVSKERMMEDQKEAIALKKKPPVALTAKQIRKS